MASNNFTIRCQSQNGSFVINELNIESTLRDLKMYIAKIEGLPPENMKILRGYPPRALAEGIDTLSLKEVGIHSGETIYVEKINGIVPQIPSGKVAILSARGNTGFTSTRCAEPAPWNEFSAFNLSAGDYARSPVPAGIMMRYIVPSNNSCLFTSVYYVISGATQDAEKSNLLRKLIAHIVSSNREKYSTAFLGMSNEDYCAWISNTNHWGGAIELAILSEHFELEIAAVDTVNLRMHRFGENCNYMNRIFLIYDGIHYDPLLMELENGQKQTIFPVDNDAPLEMAMEVAREAHSSRQYTDVANFTLRCMKCDERMRGDKEARAHALATGHVNFGEINQ